MPTTTPKEALGQPLGPPRIVQSDELLSAKEAADALGWSTSTLSRKVQENVLVPLRRDPLIFHADDIRNLGGKP